MQTVPLFCLLSEMHFKLQPLVWGTYECSCYFKEDWLVKPQMKSWLQAVPVSSETRFHLYFTMQLPPKTVWSMSTENRKALGFWKAQVCNLVPYSRRKRCSAENAWYKLKKCELDCFSPFEQIQMPIPIMGISFPCNWLLWLSLHQHRSKKNDFTTFRRLIREACNKTKAWLPASDDHTVWKYSIYWHVANFPEKQQDRAFDSAAVNHFGDLLKLHMIWEIT